MSWLERMVILSKTMKWLDVVQAVRMHLDAFTGYAKA